MSNHWLDDQLHTLEAAELIHEIARQPEIEYTFRHSLTQEATYTAILMRRRRDFHRQVGEAIETLYADRLDEFYPMLAHHFSQADDPRSLHYDRLAGDAAFRSFAIAEALVHYARAAKSAQTLDAPAEQLTHLHLRAGRCKELQGDYAGAIKFYTDLEGVAGLRNDPAVLLAALQAQATAYTIPTRAQDVDKARSLIAQALHLADQSGDQAAQAKILWTDLILHLYSGSAQEGVSSGERSVALARQLGLRELLAHVLQDLAMVYMGVGHARAAVIALVEAGPLWQEAGNLAMLAENRAHFCFYHVIAGNLAEALALADEAHQIATRIDNRWGQVNSRTFTALAHVALGNNDAVWATTQFGIEAGEEVGHPAYILNRIWRSMLYENLGDGENALTLAREADRAGERFRPFRPFSLAHLARMLARQGRLDEAVQLRKECTLHGGTQTLFVIDVWIGALDVELSLFRGDLGPALDRVHRLIDWLLEIGARFFMPEMLRLKAATLCAMGEQDQAITSLQQGVEAARDMGMRCPTWQMLMELARLQEEQGNSDSQSSYAEARSLLDWIAAHTTQVQVVHP
jgi:tetratricopeptide (TPR) repeat protein